MEIHLPSFNDHFKTKKSSLNFQSQILTSSLKFKTYIILKIGKYFSYRNTYDI